MSNPQVTFSSHVDDATIEIHVRGPGGSLLRWRLLAGLRKCVAEAPRAVLIDLRSLDDPTGQCIPTLIAGHREAASASPAVALMVCVSPGALADRLHSVGLARFIPIFPTMDQARTAARADVPSAAVRRMDLPPVDRSAALARNLVGEVCAEWHLGRILHPARLVVSELTSNAIEYARTPFTLTLSLRGPLLHVAVRDGDPTLPRLLDPAPYNPTRPLEDRGRGLRLVAAHATGWGAMPCPGGKVVWATFRLQPWSDRRSCPGPM